MSPKVRPEWAPPTDAVISANLAEAAAKLLATLTPREERVLRMRFGIGEPAEGEQPAGEEPGQDFEVTRQRIKEIEARALAKLAKRKADERPEE